MRPRFPSCMKLKITGSMLKFVDYDIVFQEVPGEVSLAVNLSCCPNACRGCHSPHLLSDAGEELCAERIEKLLERYGSGISCFCFMGGDADPDRVQELAAFLKKKSGNRLKVAWYSGKERLPERFEYAVFDYVKLGPYIEEKGGLDRETTNQRFYRIVNGSLVDQTALFRKRRHGNPEKTEGGC